MASLQVEQISIKGQKEYEGVVFPLTLNPLGSDSLTLENLCNWIKERKNDLEERLQKHGTILFRGFPINSPEDFDIMVASFGYEDFPYIGGAAPRKQVTRRVFTSDEAPSSELIPFHHEMAQSPSYPGKLFFYCDIEPSEGGETPILLSHTVYQKMKEQLPEFVDELEKKGVLYTRVMPNGDDPTTPIGRGWQSTYGVEDPLEAERQYEKLQSQFEWLPDNSLKVSTWRPAIQKDPKTGRSTSFNSTIAAYKGWRDKRNDPTKAVMFGDGTPFPQEYMEKCGSIMEESCVVFPWKRGDVLMIDNHTVMHARRSYVPPRRILACLLK
eukprot:jgi/Galph1/883/GphlegSOOS_G5663.1